MPPLRLPTPLALCAIVCALCPRLAAASACFEVLDGARTASSSQRVTLASRVRLSARCAYALTPDGPFRALEAAGREPTDFASLLLELGADGEVAQGATSIFGRTQRGQAARVESIFLAGCSEYLLSSGSGFALSVPLQTGQPRVERRPGGNCGEAGVALRFLRLPDSTANTEAEALPRVRRAPWDAALLPGQDALTLSPGRWAVYAARDAQEAALRIGRIQSAISLSPLRAALLERAPRAGERGPADEPGEGAPALEPWLRASWARGHLELEAVSGALIASDLWSELRTAAATDALWLSRGERRIGRVAVREGGQSLVLPAGQVAASMRERYGGAASTLVPTLDDWRQVLGALSLCLRERYASTGAAQRAACVPLAGLVAPLSVRGGAAGATGQLCLKRRTWTMTAQGAAPGAPQGESCVALGADSEAGEPMPLAAVGDQLTFSGSGAGQLLLCTDNRCEPMPAAGEWLRLSRAGLLEVRHAERADRALSQQGLTLARIAVIDPARQWLPVGLYHGDAAPPAEPWTALAHDEVESFVYRRGHDALDFRLAVSPGLAAAWNAKAEAPTRLTSDVPLLRRPIRGLGAPPRASLVAIATRAPVCPTAPAGKLDGDALVDPNALVVDERFYVHLAQHRGDDRPYRCVASAGFRVTERLSLRAADNLRVGLLGDVQAVVFMNRPTALGAALPLVYARLRLVYGLGIDASASVLSAVAFDDAALTRAGVGVGATLSWGPERYAPRLVSFGLLLHATDGTARREPTLSLITALNLSTLFDVVGGR